MGIQGVTNNQVLIQKPITTDAAKLTNDVLKTTTPQEPAAVFEKSEVNTLKTYEDPKKKDISALMAKYERDVSQFKQILSKYFVEQSSAYSNATKNVKAQVMEKISQGANQADIDAAKAQIAEGGYYSVDKTTDRIMSVAKAFANGDSTKIDMLKNAVEKGFKQATAAWGSTLPQISQDTYKSVMSEFDKWKSESAPKSGSLENNS